MRYGEVLILKEIVVRVKGGDSYSSPRGGACILKFEGISFSPSLRAAGRGRRGRTDLSLSRQRLVLGGGGGTWV